jgi:hypothetical protein
MSLTLIPFDMPEDIGKIGILKIVKKIYLLVSPFGIQPMKELFNV